MTKPQDTNFQWRANTLFEIKMLEIETIDLSEKIANIKRLHVDTWQLEKKVKELIIDMSLLTHKLLKHGPHN